MSTAYEPYRRPDDFGTPPSEATKTIALTIDGVDGVVNALRLQSP